MLYSFSSVCPENDRAPLLGIIFLIDRKKNQIFVNRVLRKDIRFDLTASAAVGGEAEKED